MKWKTALTAEEAALLAAGVDRFKTLAELRRAVIHVKDPPPLCDIGYGFVDLENEADEIAKFIGKAEMAEEIYEAILHEIVLADPYEKYAGSVTSVLEVALRAQISEFEDFIVPGRCTVTKLSLAKWFWLHDHDIAKKFWPSITEELVDPPQQRQAKPATTTEPTTKTKNTYLKTIAALSEGLISGLTGKPSTDAEAVLVALARKNVEAPITSRALANYLKEARELRE
jgi:hypothetical protein